MLNRVLLWADPLEDGVPPPLGPVWGQTPCSATPPAGSTMSGAKKGSSCWPYTFRHTIQQNAVAPPGCQRLRQPAGKIVIR